MMSWNVRVVVLLGGLLVSQLAMPQGQDSTPGERYLLVMAEMLPGIYDNANQNYFDRRRELPEADRHDRMHVNIERVQAPALGGVVFDWRQTRGSGADAVHSQRIVTLSAEGPDDAVVMRQYFVEGAALESDALASVTPAGLRHTTGCEYVFKRRAEGFRGSQKPGACRFDWEGLAVETANVIELSQRDMFYIDHKFDRASGERLTGVSSAEPYWLERARSFRCHADIPGVGGGRDEPFERYEPIILHDKGGMHWFETRSEPQQRIGVMLQSVTWHVLNEDNGNFNRNSLVVYVMEELADGSMKDHGYAFTEPGAVRIGVNLKWMLINCSLVPPSEAKPEL